MKSIYNPNWKSKLLAELEQAQNRFNVTQKVIEVLKPFDDKKVTRRLQTAVQKAFGDSWQVYYADDYGWYELRIWKHGLPGADYDNRVCLNLGYKQDAAFDHEWFAQGHVGYSNRLKTLSGLVLDMDKLEHAAAMLQRIEQEMKDIQASVGEVAFRQYLLSSEQR